jgi:hypothetical protein
MTEAPIVETSLFHVNSFLPAFLNSLLIPFGFTLFSRFVSINWLFRFPGADEFGVILVPNGPHFLLPE